MRYYRVSPAIWTDHQWDDETRYAALYLLTSPHRTSEGIFRMPLEYAAVDLGWTVEHVKVTFSRLMEEEFLQYDPTTHVCWIVSALKWQSPGNSNQITGTIRRLEELPESPLLHLFAKACERHAPSLSKALKKALPTLYVPRPSKNDQGIVSLVASSYELNSSSGDANASGATPIASLGADV